MIVAYINSDISVTCNEVCRVSGAVGNFVLFRLHLFGLHLAQNFVYKNILFLCPFQQLATEGILFLAVRVSVCDHILKVCEPDILQNGLWQLHRIYS